MQLMNTTVHRKKRSKYRQIIKKKVLQKIYEKYETYRPREILRFAVTRLVRRDRSFVSPTKQ